MPDSLIPVVDLFAGPGGLGEGFSRVDDSEGKKVFKTVISIEKDPHARQTLRLRAYYRHFKNCGKKLPDYFFSLIRSGNSKEKTSAHKLLSQDPLWKEVCREVPEWTRDGKPSCELGQDNDHIYTAIKDRLRGAKNWVLIGGPPCQAYSLLAILSNLFIVFVVLIQDYLIVLEIFWLIS